MAYSSRIFLFLFTIFILILFLLFIYCFVLFSCEKWFIWSRYPQINEVREGFWLLDGLSRQDYLLIVRYNFTRKIIYAISITVQIKMKLTPLLFTFLMISTQTLYSNMIIGLYQFSSQITRGLISFNGFMMTNVLISSIEYLNETFE